MPYFLCNKGGRKYVRFKTIRLYKKRLDKYVYEKSSRKVTNRKGAFSSVDYVYKLLYLRIEELKDKWNKPIPNLKKISLQLAEI